MRKTALLIALGVLLLPVHDADARKRQPPVDTYERTTDWVPLSKSMTELLDEGWRIVGFNNYQTEMFSNNFASYNFVLLNGDKYVVCFITDPAMNDAKSKCRALN